MQISGNLEDVSLIDVLQILGLTGQSGVLLVEQSAKRAKITFSKGKIMAASLEPHHTYMTSLLLERGEISLETLHEALQIQKGQTGNRQPIGAILLELGAVSHSQLQDALHKYIQSIINELASWLEGEFSFAVGPPRQSDSLGFLPDQVALDIDISLQELILEAARFQDEAQHRKTLPGSLACEETNEEDDVDRLLGESAGPKCQQPVVLLSTDLLVQHGLEGALQALSFRLHVVRTIQQVGSLLPVLQDERPVVVVDINGNADRPPGQAILCDEVIRLRQQWPDIPIISFGHVEDARVYDLFSADNVAFHVPRPAREAADSIEVLRMFIQSLGQVVEQVASRSAMATGLTPGPAAEQLNQVSDLYQTVVELRHSHQSVTVSLEVLRYVAQELERVVLMIVQGQTLTVLGIGGIKGDNGADLRKQLCNLRLPLSDHSVIQKVLTEKCVTQQKVSTTDPTLGKLFEIFGPPVRPEALLIPLIVWNRVSVIIYADNGGQNTELCPGAPLGVLAELGSLMLENLLLRRRHKKKAGPEGDATRSDPDPGAKGDAGQRQLLPSAAKE